MRKETQSSPKDRPKAGCPPTPLSNYPSGIFLCGADGAPLVSEQPSGRAMVFLVVGDQELASDFVVIMCASGNKRGPHDGQ